MVLPKETICYSSLHSLQMITLVFVETRTGLAPTVRAGRGKKKTQVATSEFRLVVPSQPG